MFFLLLYNVMYHPTVLNYCIGLPYLLCSRYKYFISIFCSIWQYWFFITNLPPQCAGPPPTTHPPPRVFIYFTRLQLTALLCYTGSWGGGVVHILGLLGVVHTFINRKTTLQNLCLHNILCLNTSQSDSNSLKIIIRLHCLRLYIQYLVQ